jgi:malonate transporter
VQSFLLLLPDFALIALGVALRRFAGLGDGFWPGAERLVYFVLFPALLFHALARASIDLTAMGPLFAVGLLTMAGGLVLGFLGRPLLGPGAMSFASRVQCAYRFNTYIGIAVAGKFGGAAGGGDHGRAVRRDGAVCQHGGGGFAGPSRPGRLGRELARNPLIIATVAGMAFNLSGAQLPAPVVPFLQRLADAAVTLGLLAVGAALRVGIARRAGDWVRPTCARSSCWRLPALAWGLASVFGLTGIAFAMAVILQPCQRLRRPTFWPCAWAATGRGWPG